VVTPRVAISQAPYDRDVEGSLARALAHMRRARQLGADLIVFPEWFLGLNPPEAMPSRAIKALAEAARELSLGVVTGTLRVLDPLTHRKQQRALVLDVDGRVLGSQAKCELDAPERPWFEPGDGILPIPTRWGRIVLLLGPDVLSPARWAEARRAGPALVVMASNAKTPGDQRTLEDLALTRSLETGALVALAPLIGRFAGATYVGAALGCHHGQALGEPDASAAVVLVSERDAAQVALGALDACSWAPAHPAAPAEIDLSPDDLRQPIAERRVLLDWTALCGSDPLALGRALLKMTEDNPRLTALAPAHPDHPRALESLLAEGAGGAFAWPALTGRRADEPGYRVLASILARYRRPLVVYAGPGPVPLSLSHPEDWDATVLTHPDLPLVLVASGEADPFRSEALCLARYRDNVWLEWSRAPLSFWDEVRDTIGFGRILFGSGGRAGAFPDEWARLTTWAEERHLTTAEWEAVAHDNAQQLFFSAPSRQEAVGAV